MIKLFLQRTFNSLIFVQRQQSLFMFSGETENKGSSATIKCYNCGGLGHTSKDCTK